MAVDNSRAGRGPRRLPEAHVPRPRLVDRLRTRARVTLVCAPAGFGKSTLIREWLNTTHEKVLYYSFVSHEESTARMWSTILRDLKSVDPNRSDSLLGLFASSPLDDQRVVAEFVDEVSFVDDVAIVLEDLHNVDSDDARRQIRMLVEMLGDRARIVLTSRQLPDLPLALLRSRGDLVEIGATELRLTADEVRSLAERPHDHNGNEIATVSDPDVVLESTDGWPAGVSLLLRGAGGTPSPAHLDWTTKGVVGDLLRTEILDQLPAAHRSLLVQTSFLDAWTPGLSDRVTGTASSERILDELASSGTFIFRVSGEGDWYRPHQLLGDLLRAEFDRLPTDDQTEFRRRASEWYEEHGFPIEAVQLAMAAGLDERCVDLVLRHAIELTDLGHQQLAAHVLRSPAARQYDDPERQFRIAVAFAFAGQGGETLDALGRLERLIAASPGPEPSVLRKAAVFRCLVSSFAGDLPAAERADEEVRRRWERVPSDELARRTHFNYARCLRLAGRLDEAEQLLRGLIPPPDGRETTVSIFARGAWSLLLLDRGELDRAREEAEHAVRLWTERGMAWVSGICDAFRAIAAHAIELGDLERADEATRDALRASTAIRPGLARALVLVDASRAAAEAGDIDGANDALAEIRMWWREFPPGPQLLHHVHAAQFDVALASRNHQLAAVTLALIEELDAGVPSEAPVLRARLLLAMGDADAAARVGLTDAPHRPLPGRIEQLLLRAEVARALGNHDDCVALATRALELGLPVGFRRTFARSPAVRILREELLPPELVPAFRLALGPHGPPADTSAMPTFTERELDVLRLLPTHLSYAGIAAELYVSVNTAKFHVKNLYTKLDVRSRHEAVEQARALGLVD